MDSVWGFFSSKWREQCFDNFHRAMHLLREPFDEKSIAEFSALEQEGIVQRYEFCFELAWKTLKDYLEYSGIVIDPVTPRNTIKHAFAANIIANGELWIEMLEKRNLLSHTYDRSLLEKALHDLKDRFLPALEASYEFLLDKKLRA